MACVAGSAAVVGLKSNQTVNESKIGKLGFVSGGVGLNQSRALPFLGLKCGSRRSFGSSIGMFLLVCLTVFFYV